MSAPASGRRLGGDPRGEPTFKSLVGKLSEALAEDLGRRLAYGLPHRLRFRSRRVATAGRSCFSGTLDVTNVASLLCRDVVRQL